MRVDFRAAKSVELGSRSEKFERLTIGPCHPAGPYVRVLRYQWHWTTPGW